MALAEFSTKWLASKGSLRPSTVDLYQYLLRAHILPELGEVSLSRPSAAVVREWNANLRSGTLSETSAAKAYRLLRQICQVAVDDRLMRENPCRIKGAAAGL